MWYEARQKKDNVITDGDNIEKQFISESLPLPCSGNNYDK